MIVYPAIDLRGGQVVRLQEGDPTRQTTFSADPLATAKAWIDQGATWIHMVNLDGAFDESNENLRILEAAARLDVELQFGGGLRDLAGLARALDAGADRVVIGTLAVKSPESAVAAVERFGGDAVCIALDARDGKIATHGWQETTSVTPAAFGSWLARRGAKHALYTDVARDGMLSGVDVAGTTALARETGLRVIASGGARDLDDIKRLAESGLVAGVVVGMALYLGRFTLEAALEMAKARREC